MKLKNLISSFFLAPFLISVFQLGCEDKIVEPEIPASNVSYSAHIQPLFNQSCTSGCHDDINREGNLSLTTWANTTADPSIVFPGEPENSRLVWSIEGRPGSSPMPPILSGKPPLKDNQVEGIKTWIKEGAKNN